MTQNSPNTVNFKANRFLSPIREDDQLEEPKIKWNRLKSIVKGAVQEPSEIHESRMTRNTHSTTGSGGQSLTKINLLKRIMKTSNKTGQLPRGLNLYYLRDKLKEILPEHEANIDLKLMRKCYGVAKMTTVAYGPSKLQFDMDVDRNIRLIFAEFLVFICLFTRMIFTGRQKTVPNVSFNEDLRQTVKELLKNNGLTKGLEMVEIPDPEQDENLTSEIKETLVGGKV